MSLIADNDERAARIEVLQQCAAVLSKTEDEYVEGARAKHRAFAGWVAARGKGEGSFIHMCERLDLDPAEVRARMGR